VVSATAGPFGMPIESGGFPNPVWIESVPSPAGTLPPFHPFRIVMPGYFETFGIPIVEGRPIDRRDIEQETGAVVVSQAFARRFWPNGQAIGQRLRQVPDEPWFTIVGVASNTSDAGLAAAPDTIVYWPVKGVGGETYTSLSAMSYAVHTVTDPGRLAASIRDALREVAPQIPVASMRTMDEARASSMSRVTFTMTILAVGAIMAILIAAVGTYGVVAYTVSRRTKEIGVRMALGATARRIRRMVLQEGLQVTLAGLALGLAGSAMSVRFLGTFLFQVSPLDPVTYAAVTLVGLCVAALACLIPARRASRVDPLVALRAD
ncbi:MAG: FtsX-like permease family protein, partial [Vicinamibacterales bacterium]